MILSVDYWKKITTKQLNVIYFKLMKFILIQYITNMTPSFYSLSLFTDKEKIISP